MVGKHKLKSKQNCSARKNRRDKEEFVLGKTILTAPLLDMMMIFTTVERSHTLIMQNRRLPTSLKT